MSVVQGYTETAFDSSRKLFDALTTRLSSEETSSMEHGLLEDVIGEDGTALLRQLLQDQLTLRAVREAREDLVEGADGVARTHVRARTRTLESVFGTVEVSRLAYGVRGRSSLMPADTVLNLPPERHSDGVRRRVAEEASRGSFDEVVAAIKRTTGAKVAKRQAEELAAIAGSDFDDFYEQRSMGREESEDLLILTVDGKGIVMRREALSPDTRKAAARLAKQRPWRPRKENDAGRRRMATVASVYTVERHVRTPEDVMGQLRGGPKLVANTSRPPVENKRVWASIERSSEDVIRHTFAEALRRDPERTRKWVVLVDGNETQIDRINKVAKEVGVEVTLVLDFIHVLQYLWGAGNALRGTGSKDAERWVVERATLLLEGKASDVAAGMRRSATRRGLRGRKRKAVHKCADYLLKYKHMLHYDTCLESGYPIATGVIEGACRHLIKDRLDITGARWGLAGAEAVLRLRSLRASGDFEEYWTFHQRRRLAENHLSRYAGSQLASAA